MVKKKETKKEPMKLQMSLRKRLLQMSMRRLGPPLLQNFWRVCWKDSCNGSVGDKCADSVQKHMA